MPESSGNSSFNKSFAFKFIFSFVGMKEVIINSFDINSKQRFKSFCDKQLKLLLKRKSERKNIFKKSLYGVLIRLLFYGKVTIFLLTQPKSNHSFLSIHFLQTSIILRTTSIMHSIPILSCIFQFNIQIILKIIPPAIGIVWHVLNCRYYCFFNF